MVPLLLWACYVVEGECGCRKAPISKRGVVGCFLHAVEGTKLSCAQTGCFHGGRRGRLQNSLIGLLGKGFNFGAPPASIPCPILGGRPVDR